MKIVLEKNIKCKNRVKNSKSYYARFYMHKNNYYFIQYLILKFGNTKIFYLEITYFSIIKSHSLQWIEPSKLVKTQTVTPTNECFLV